jgi:hypothetical protein
MTFTVSPANGVKSLGNSSTANVGGANTLNGGIDDTTTTILLNDSSMFPTAGTMKIEDEYITFTSNNGTELSGGVRGAFNSTAVSHTGTTAVIGVYIGISELNTQPDVMVSLKSDTSGIEHLDFSVDNVLWDTFPVSGFQASANIHEFHIAVKGVRYFRIRFENGSAAATTAFRVNTYFGVFRQGNLPLNQSVGADSDSTIVRAVGLGEQPDGSFVNTKSNGVLFVTDEVLANGATFASGCVSLVGYQQVQTGITASADGSIEIKFYADEGCLNLVRTLTIPYLTADGFELFAAPAFSDYVEYKFTNTGILQTNFHYETKALTAALSGQVLSTVSTIVPQMVANLGRNILVGQEPDETFANQRIDGVAFRTEVPLTAGTINVYTSPVISLLNHIPTLSILGCKLEILTPGGC